MSSRVCEEMPRNVRDVDEEGALVFTKRPPKRPGYARSDRLVVVKTQATEGGARKLYEVPHLSSIPDKGQHSTYNNRKSGVCGAVLVLDSNRLVYEEACLVRGCRRYWGERAWFKVELAFRRENEHDGY